MAPVTKSALVRAIGKHTDEVETDPRAVAILFQRGRGQKNWSKLALQVGISESRAKEIFHKELRRRAAERAQFADAEIEQLLADWDADLVAINDLIAETETLDLVDLDGKLGPRILGFAKLLEQKRGIAKLKIDLLGLNAPNRVNVLVAQTAGMPSLEEMETWPLEKLEAELTRQKQLMTAATQPVIDTTCEPVEPRAATETEPAVVANDGAAGSDPAEAKPAP
jgi:hypothetical protein